MLPMCGVAHEPCAVGTGGSAPWEQRQQHPLSVHSVGILLRECMLSTETQLPVLSILEGQLFHKLMGGCCHLTVEVETERRKMLLGLLPGWSSLEGGISRCCKVVLTHLSRGEGNYIYLVQS